MAYLTPNDRYTGAAIGAFIGDALAMPAHWYYDRAAIRRDYGVIDGYCAPRRLHPDSVLSRPDFKVGPEEADIIGDDLVFWGTQNVHYHQRLRPGENTLNLKLLHNALELVYGPGGYDRATYVDRYVEILRMPSEHHDTYLESCHREFFRNLRSGVPRGECAVDERHIGGLVSAVPLYIALRSTGSDDIRARETAVAHVTVTHKGTMVRDAATTLLTLASELAEGASLQQTIDGHLARQDLPYLGKPFAKLASRPDAEVIGPLYSPSCDIPESLPATLYLARKYADSPRRGLVANVMVGGDNCHRGAVLGALIGLSRGPSVFPEDWRLGLIAEIPTAQAEGSNK